MKNFTNVLAIAFLSLCSFKGIAQNNLASKPALFSNYPPIINCTEAQLSTFFSHGQGQEVNISFPANFRLSGPVTSNEQKFSNLQTVVVRLSEFNNILFAISKRLDENNNPVYIGHLFNRDYSDGYELARSESGTYQFIKIQTERLQPTCNQ